MILKDDSNKYKLQLNQLYREVESYKASLYSYEKHCEKLKHLNSELNKTLSEEREQNEKGRQKVKLQMSSLNNKVNELEGFSMSVENTNRDFHKKSDYLMQRMLDVREYVIAGDALTNRTNAAPGTVRSNLSGMFSSVSKNPLEFNNCDENAEEITRDIKTKFDDLKRKIFNYQNAINKLQGEKQQLYQSVNQLQVDRSQSFNTPNTKAATNSMKKSSLPVTENKQSDKSDAMIEYLRTEITHLREKNKNIQDNFERYKSQNEAVKTCSTPLIDLMAEILRPGKDLIYQLCTDPHLSESFFYKDDPKFEGLDSKFCLDVPKIFDLSNERIVDLRTILEQKDHIINELDRKLIELKVKFNQNEQMKKSHEQSVNSEIQHNFEGLDKKCREFASNLKVLAAELEKEKMKCERLEKENKYLKDHIQHKLDAQQNQEILQANFESRLKIAKEEGIRQGRREGLVDSKVNEYIAKYKLEIDEQANKIVDLEEQKERLEMDCHRLHNEVEKVNKQIISERNLQQTLSKEIEHLTMEVKALKHVRDD